MTIPATASNMVFDEVFDDADCPTMDNIAAAIKCTSRYDSPPHQQVVADSYAMPIVVPASPCTSEESSTSAATAARSITGNFSDIRDKYHIDTRVLGRGHYGKVRECINRTTGQRYAVKSIRTSDPRVKPDIIAREIILLQQVEHDSIVKLIDFYEDEKYIHLVTDLCTGGELYDKICENSSNDDNGAACFAEDEAGRILSQVLSAISYLHKNDVVHRDIKPENILFETADEGSPVKLCDFGLARKHYGSGRLGEPVMNEVVGTAYYIAPEVLRKKYTKSCDLWSVGVTAYILLGGYPPFNGSNNAEIYDSVVRGVYHFHSEEWKGVSKDARDFISRLLQKDPRKRMTVDEALNHSWIARHANADNLTRSPKDASTTNEVVARGLRSINARIAKRKLRKSMFGLAA